MKQPGSGDAVGVGYVIDHSLQQLAKLVFLTFIIAWCLTLTSKSLLLNLPLAIVSVLSGLWLIANLQPEPSKPQRRSRDAGNEGEAVRIPSPPLEPASSQKPSKWRDRVGSGVVEGAWETLCGSILQEFVYDMWYSALTPDREFPREIRRVLNTAFGELAARARRADLKGMLLRDVSELVIDQIELYRVTRESIVQGLDAEAWLNMPQAARDRAMLAELKAENNLHPALWPHDAAAVRGHYKVIHTISEGLVAFLMERSDHGKTMMRSVARELLATCVLRQTILQFTPYNVNKLILALLQKRIERKPLDVEEAAAAAQAKVVQPDAAKGSWDFTERARQSIRQEERQACTRPRPQKRQPKPQAAAAAKPSPVPPSPFPAEVSTSTPLQPLHGQTSSKSDAEAARDETPAQPRQHLPATGSQEATPSRPSHSRSNSNASDAGNVMGLPAAAAHWRSRGGFIGQPRARVVAAELNSEGSKDVVMYKIRVADGTGEWTVSRRFRNFEALHRNLKELPSYRLRMPAKRVFTHSQTVEFVEERRQQLDTFLQHILREPTLCGRQEVWEFLSAWSEIYGMDCDASLLGTINASLRDVNVNVRRAVGDIVDDLDAKRRKANASLSKLASTISADGMVGRQTPQAFMGRGLPSMGSWDSLQGRAQTRSPSPAAAGRKTAGIEHPHLEHEAGEAAEHPLREEFQGQLLHYTYVPASTPRSTPSRGSPSGSLLLDKSPDRGGGQQHANSGGSVAAAENRDTPDGGRHRRTAESGAETSKLPEQADADAASQSQAGPSEGHIGEELESGSLLAPAADSGHIKLTAALPLSPQQASEKLAAVPPAIVPSSLAKAVEGREDLTGSELEEAAGVSAPLYDIVDVLFQLQGRGFFRRQVFVVARQVLSLVAGGAIDEYILSQLRSLRQEHQLARLIHTLQVLLWPGGTWFQRLPERQNPPSPLPQPRFIMTPEIYCKHAGPDPLDAEEIQEAVRDLLLSSAPPALIRVIGRDSYEAGMRDLFDMLQSMPFMQQLGYGLLRILLVNLLPELKPLFRSIERSVPADSPARAG